MHKVKMIGLVAIATMGVTLSAGISFAAGNDQSWEQGFSSTLIGAGLNTISFIDGKDHCVTAYGEINPNNAQKKYTSQEQYAKLGFANKKPSSPNSVICPSSPKDASQICNKYVQAAATASNSLPSSTKKVTVDFRQALLYGDLYMVGACVGPAKHG
jgi:hypothetical protein